MKHARAFYLEREGRFYEEGLAGLCALSFCSRQGPKCRSAPNSVVVAAAAFAHILDVYSCTRVEYIGGSG